MAIGHWINGGLDKFVPAQPFQFDILGSSLMTRFISDAENGRKILF